MFSANDAAEVAIASDNFMSLGWSLPKHIYQHQSREISITYFIGAAAEFK